LQRQAILILGMHRTGTSALAGVVSALGAAKPKSLMPGDPSNARGHFESAALAVAHDELLASLGSHWRDWRQLDPDWIRSEASTQWRQKIKQLLLEEFGDEPFIVVKDPRICRFVPFVLSIFADLGIRSAAILTLRHPLEVARSLQERDGTPPTEAVLSWLRHVLDAEFHSRGLPRVFVAYENLLTDWRHELDRAAKQLAIRWPSWPDGLDDGAIDQFLSLDLRHQRALPSQLMDSHQVIASARETYAIMSVFATSSEVPEALARLDAIRSRFNEACEVFGPAMAARAATHSELSNGRHALGGGHTGVTAERDELASANRELSRRHDALGRELAKVLRERDALSRAYGDAMAERDALRSSRSWRWTAPLRSLRRVSCSISKRKWRNWRR
jgi:hypothetical protein